MNDLPPDKLSDVLQHQLRVVFCGTAAGNESARRQEYYAGPGNKFWDTLFKVGLTPTRFQPKEFRRVLEYGIGLTDVAKKHSGVDSSIPTSAYAPVVVHDKISLYKPKLLAFNGKEAARRFYGWKRTQYVEYGPQELWVGETQVWILPSTSGSANGYWDIEWWRKLAAQVANI